VLLSVEIIAENSLILDPAPGGRGKATRPTAAEQSVAAAIRRAAATGVRAVV
jgi:hypothetical protein